MILTGSCFWRPESVLLEDLKMSFLVSFDWRFREPCLNLFSFYWQGELIFVLWFYLVGKWVGTKLHSGTWGLALGGASFNKGW